MEQFYVLHFVDFMRQLNVLVDMVYRVVRLRGLREFAQFFQGQVHASERLWFLFGRLVFITFVRVGVKTLHLSLLNVILDIVNDTILGFASVVFDRLRPSNHELL